MESNYRTIWAWVVYSSIYLLCFVGLSLFFGLYLREWQSHNWLSTLADIAGGSIGIALLVVVAAEGGRGLVLLYPMLKKHLQEEARQKGHEEGRQKDRQEGRQETHGAWETWLKRRDEAHANNQPFDEPPPSHKKTQV